MDNRGTAVCTAVAAIAAAADGYAWLNQAPGISFFPMIAGGAQTVMAQYDNYDLGGSQWDCNTGLSDEGEDGDPK